MINNVYIYIYIYIKLLLAKLAAVVRPIPGTAGALAETGSHRQSLRFSMATNVSHRDHVRKGPPVRPDAAAEATGHSMGGAIANLFASSTQQFQKISERTCFHMISCEFVNFEWRRSTI